MIRLRPFLYEHRLRISFIHKGIVVFNFFMKGEKTNRNEGGSIKKVYPIGYTSR